MTTVNIKSIHANVTAALQAAATYGARIDTLKTLLAGVPREDAQGIITAPIGAHYGIKVLTGTKGPTFDRESASYEAAKKARTRLLQDVYGKSESAHTAPVVQRFNRAKVEAIQQCIAGMSKAEARAYFAKALEAAFA